MEEEGTILSNVPDTLDTETKEEEKKEETVVENNTSEVEDDSQVQEEQEEKEPKKEEDTNTDEKKYTQEQINNMIESRLARERRDYDRNKEKEFSSYRELERIMKYALGAKDIDEIITKTKEGYISQGVNIPDIITNKPIVNERDELILAKADAEEIMKAGYESMRDEANRIAKMPKEERSVRDNAIFNVLASELMRQKQKQELKNKGYDTKVLENEEFKNYSSKFNPQTPISEVYEMYLKTKNQAPTVSTGSVKTNTASVKKFSQDQIDKMTSEEMLKVWDDPEFRKIAGLN